MWSQSWTQLSDFHFSVSIEAWWVVQAGCITEDDIKTCTLPEKCSIDKITDAGPQLSGSLDYSVVHSLYGASQVMLMVKNLPANAGDVRDVGLVPGSGRSPGGGRGNPFRYSCLENAMDRRAWPATVHRVAQSRTQMKQLSTHVHCLYNRIYLSGDSCIAVPPLDHVVMNQCKVIILKPSEVFFSIDEHTNAAELTRVLEIDLSLVKNVLRYC